MAHDVKLKTVPTEFKREGDVWVVQLPRFGPEGTHYHTLGLLTPYFEGLTKGKLLGTYCENKKCPTSHGESELWLPPRADCPDCHQPMKWKEVEKPEGYIYSYTNPEMVEDEDRKVDIHIQVVEGEQYRLGRLEFSGSNSGRGAYWRRAPCFFAPRSSAARLRCLGLHQPCPFAGQRRGSPPRQSPIWTFQPPFRIIHATARVLLFGSPQRCAGDWGSP